ncbi:response regulator [Brevundimonas naejangsanensis]|uniref:histidine kinase n=1 Tax=Brevundimonas naejangsanensis TaxID=588932 RepID=A0A494RDL4_9CAUL|nr:ATP-binding protein [Brevundimonas naejangsanensis]AYG94241.1 response regulator [Brevundimonas naejangsanensis]
MTIASAAASPLTGQPQTACGEAADLATFFDVSLDLLVIRDLDGAIVRASASWAATLGYAPDDLVGLAILTLVHPDDLPCTLDAATEVENRRPGDPVRGHVNRYRHRDGRYVTLEWRAQKFGDRIYAVARDVTAKIAADQALLEAKAAAEAASRAKSDFLANMSHEIRTPLNGVIGIVDALSRTALSPEQAEMVSLISASGVTLQRLVSDMLDVSRTEAGGLELELRPFDLDEALGPALETLRLRAEDKGLAFRVERPAHVRGVFMGDSVRIGQILGNLLSNAVKFTTEGAVIVRLALSESDGAPGLLMIEVEDTGVGFDADHAARLFQRFSQADSSITRRFGGTGLGLSICRSLTEMMGGRIEAASTPGLGSRFRVELPLPRANEVETRVAAAALPSRPLRVLLAEDHPVNQRLVQLILADHAAELVIVEDGAEAVAAFEAGRFDVVLMDMQMPGMDGLTATRALRAAEAVRPGTPRTPILMLSANAMAEHRDAARDAGADLHLAKPITARDLLTALAMLAAG